MYTFCTYFDRNYLTRGLALYNSLKKLNIDFKLWILCFDSDTYEIFTRFAFPEVVPIDLLTFENYYPELLTVKSERTRVEYYWTCTPKLPDYVLGKGRDIDIVTYLDADLFFFSDPGPAYEEFGSQSIYLVDHRFGDQHKRGEAGAGKYNVGYMMFRNDRNGRDALAWWGGECVTWCYNRSEDGKCGDQKYVEEFPRRFKGVTETRLKGVGLGQWNFFNYRFIEKNDRLYVDEEPVVVFHFNDIEIVGRRSVRTNAMRPWACLFRPYAQALREAIMQVREIEPAFEYGIQKISGRAWLRNLLNGSIDFRL
ncbi:MAG: hypothetical protein JW860_02985 [Sedimentisphaerales bacterium]|nr:hypothetical protein [Sedimentisphaerales bacterium]